MNTVTLLHVSSGPLSNLTVEFAAGLHAVVGAEHDGTLELVQLIAGALRPRIGSVRVGERDPRTNPHVRARIATSLASRFEERTVSEAIERRQRLRPLANGAKAALERAGLEGLLSRSPASLDEREQAALGLVLALNAKDPSAVLLHEPLDRGTLLDRAFVLAALRRHAEHAPVICTTARPELVNELTDTALWLEAGRLRRSTSPTTAPAVRPGVAPSVVVSCSDAARLAHALSSEPSLLELSYVRDQGLVEVRGEHLDTLCLTVCRSARAANVTLHQLTQAFPELPEVRAVHAAMARTAYERAYGQLRAQPNEGPRK